MAWLRQTIRILMAPIQLMGLAATAGLGLCETPRILLALGALAFAPPVFDLDPASEPEAIVRISQILAGP